MKYNITLEKIMGPLGLNIVGNIWDNVYTWINKIYSKD